MEHFHNGSQKENRKMCYGAVSNLESCWKKELVSEFCLQAIFFLNKLERVIQGGSL